MPIFQGWGDGPLAAKEFSMEMFTSRELPTRRSVPETMAGRLVMWRAGGIFKAIGHVGSDGVSLGPSRINQRRSASSGQ
jgi:hypothetical protein